MNCLYCDQHFYNRRVTAMFCSASCRVSCNNTAKTLFDKDGTPSLVYYDKWGVLVAQKEEGDTRMRRARLLRD